MTASSSKLPDISISRLSCEHYELPLGIDSRHSKPRLSWRFAGTAKNWRQASYTLEITFKNSAPQTYTVSSSASVLVPWPVRAFQSREIADVRVKVEGKDGLSTAWSDTLAIEAAIFSAEDWKAVVLSGDAQETDAPKRPQYLRASFHVEDPTTQSARVYATAFGCYEAFVNGRKVGKDILAPGWQSYKHRHHFQTYDLTGYLRSGANTLGVVVGEGWYATRLNFGGGRRNIYGSDIGAMVQVELDGHPVLVTSTSEGGWEWCYGPILSSEIYDGEVFDSQQQDPVWAKTPAPGSATKMQWQSSVRSLGTPKGRLLAAECPPVRVTETLRAKELITTPSGHLILDFGENIVGRLRVDRQPGVPAGSTIILKHAEVLENSELGTRPLRLAKAQVKLISGGDLVGYTPTFTFHGFRYVQVEGWPELDLDCLTAEFIHTDMERTGWFDCSHGFINQLHSNALRSLRGNFVSVPTDCPQRDERLGWTGDLQVFASTANYLYDTTSTLASWLQDLSEEQIKDYDSVVPLVVPNTLSDMFGPPPPSAIWGDVAVLTPRDIYQSSGDRIILKQQYESMQAWLDKGVVRSVSGLWSSELMQFGDWLDPKAPPDAPWEGRTDNILAANAWLVHTTGVMSEICALLGEKEKSDSYRKMYDKLRQAFQQEYVTPAGRMISDSQGALAMGLAFGLTPDKHLDAARQRLDVLVRKAIFKVSTGFAATPLILHVLSDNGLLPLAYRMLQEGECPSWLYPVSMGATTIVSALC